LARGRPARLVRGTGPPGGFAVAAPGQLERHDCERKRNGTASLSVFLDVHRPWRKVNVTDGRTAADFAACMQELVDVHFPKAERIRVVLDDLSTHTARALYREGAHQNGARLPETLRQGVKNHYDDEVLVRAFASRRRRQ
jgi:hypothetical protein